MEYKAGSRRNYITNKINELKKILGTFESKQKDTQFKEGNKGRKQRQFKITTSRTLVVFIIKLSFFKAAFI
jgi:hypothetical protein